MAAGVVRCATWTHRRGVVRQIAIIAAVTAVAAVYVAFPNPRADLTVFNCDDGEAYIGLANGLATGRGYTRCLNPDQYIPHKSWPPGFPLLLAPVVRAFGTNLAVLKLTVCGIGAVGLAFLYLLVRDLTDGRLAAWVTAATACSAHYFWFSHQTMTEVPAFSASVAALWLLQRALREPTRWQWWCLAGLVIGYGAIIRATTLFLVAVPLVAALRIARTDRRAVALRYAAFLALSIAPTIGWGIRNSHVQAEHFDNVNQFRMMLQDSPMDMEFRWITPAQIGTQVYRNIAWGMVYRVPAQTLPLVWLLDLRGWPGGRFIALPLTLAILAAAAVTVRRRLWPMHLYVAASALLLCYWCFGFSARFWVPVTPFFIFMVGAAVYRSRWWPRLGRAGPILACVWLGAAAVDLVAAVHRQETRPYAEPVWYAFEDIASRARASTSPDDVIYVHNQNAFALMSGRRTWITQPGDVEDLLDGFRNGHITHMVVSRGATQRDHHPRKWRADHAHLFKRIATNGTYDVYKYAGPRSQT